MKRKYWILVLLCTSLSIVALLAVNFLKIAPEKDKAITEQQGHLFEYRYEEDGRRIIRKFFPNSSKIAITYSRGGDQGYFTSTYLTYVKSGEKPILTRTVRVRDGRLKPNFWEKRDTLYDQQLIHLFKKRVWNTGPDTLKSVECMNLQHYPHLNLYQYGVYLNEGDTINSYAIKTADCVKDLKRYRPIIEIFNDTNFVRYTADQLADNAMLDSVISWELAKKK